MGLYPCDNVYKERRVKHRFYFATIVGLLLTGCAQYKWQKSGATQADFNRDKYECQREAAQVYPPQVVRQQITTGYTTPSTTNCSSTGSTYGNYSYTNCTTTPGQYVPGASTDTDVNADSRERMGKQCMYARGWQLVEVKK